MYKRTTSIWILLRSSLFHHTRKEFQTRDGRDNISLLLIIVDPYNLGPMSHDTSSISGKTSLLYKLSLGNLVETKPTMGFNVETILYNNHTITLWDMGGTPSIRKLWKHYYLNCHGE